MPISGYFSSGSSGGTTNFNYNRSTGAPSSSYTPMRDRGFPERISASSPGLDLFYAAGLAPSRAAETPFSMASTLYERITGQTPTPQGATPYKKPGLIENIFNFSGAVINSGQMGIVQQYGDKPDDFVYPIFAGTPTQTIGQLKQELIGRGVLFDPETGKEMTWDQLVSRLKNGQLNTLSFGHVMTSDSPEADFVARTLLDPTNLIFLGGGTVVRAGVGGAIRGFRLGMGGERAAHASLLGARASAGYQLGARTGPFFHAAQQAAVGNPSLMQVMNNVRRVTGWSPKAPPLDLRASTRQLLSGTTTGPVGMSNIAQFLYNKTPTLMRQTELARQVGAVAARPVVAIGKRAIDPRGYIRSPKDYLKSSLALQVSGHALGNLSWSLDQLLGGETPFAAGYEFMHDVEAKNPLSENIVGVLLTAAVMPYGEIAGNAVQAGVKNRIRTFGTGFEQELARRYTGGVGPENMQLLHETLGGPDKVSDVVMYSLLEQTRQLLAAPERTRRGREQIKAPGTEMVYVSEPSPRITELTNELEIGASVPFYTDYIFTKLNEFIEDGTINAQSFYEHIDHAQNNSRGYGPILSSSKQRGLEQTNPFLDPNAPVDARLRPLWELAEFHEKRRALGSHLGNLSARVNVALNPWRGIWKEDIYEIIYKAMYGKAADRLGIGELRNVDDISDFVEFSQRPGIAEDVLSKETIANIVSRYPALAQRDKTGQLLKWAKYGGATIGELIPLLADRYEFRPRQVDYFRMGGGSYQDHLLRRKMLDEGVEYDMLPAESRLLRLDQLQQEMVTDAELARASRERRGIDLSQEPQLTMELREDFQAVMDAYQVPRDRQLQMYERIEAEFDTLGPNENGWHLYARAFSEEGIPIQSIQVFQDAFNRVLIKQAEHQFFLKHTISLNDRMIKLRRYAELEEMLIKKAQSRKWSLTGNRIKKFVDENEWKYTYEYKKLRAELKNELARKSFMLRQAPYSGAFHKLPRPERIMRLRTEVVLRTGKDRKIFKEALRHEEEVQALLDKNAIKEADNKMLTQEYADALDAADQIADEWHVPLTTRGNPRDFTPAEIQKMEVLTDQVLQANDMYTVKTASRRQAPNIPSRITEVMSRSVWADQMIKRRTALGEAVFDQGALAPFTRYAQMLYRPIKGSTQAHLARQALYNELVPYGVTTKEIDAYIQKAESHVQHLKMAPFGLHVRFFGDVAHLPASTLNSLAAEFWGPNHPMFAAIGGQDAFHLTFDRAMSRYYRGVSQRAQQGGVVGRMARLADNAYREMQGSRELKSSDSRKTYDAARAVSKQFYFMWRFMLDPRWHVLNATERYTMMGMEHGIVRDLSNLDASQVPARSRFHAHQMLHGTLQDPSDTGWFLGRPIEAALVRSHAELTLKRGERILDELPATWAPMRKLKERWRNELDDQLAAGTITEKQYAMEISDLNKSLTQALQETLYEGFDRKGIRKTIDDEAKRIFSNEELQAAAPLIQKLYDMNSNTWRELNRMLVGNPQRRTIERVMNSFWLYWPISYQLKALKWLSKTMLDGSFGHDNHALLAGVYANWKNAHEERMTNNPSYAAFFEENTDIWFMAQMLMPIVPWDTSVTLSRPVRALGDWVGLFDDYARAQDPVQAFGWFLEMGPMYTWSLLSRAAEGLGGLVDSGSQSQPIQLPQQISPSTIPLAPPAQ